MARIRRRALLAGVLLLSVPPAVDAAQEFEKVGTLGGQIRFLLPNARSAAMGGAHVALAPGPTAAYWNVGALGLPATGGALAYCNRRATPGGHDRLHSFSGNGTYRGIGMGGYLSLRRAEEPVRTVYQPDGDGSTYETSDYAGTVGGGIDLARQLPILPPNMQWGVGAGVAFVHSELADHAAGTWDLDVGTLFQWTVDLGRSAPDRPAKRERLSLRAGYAIWNALERKLRYADGQSSRLARWDRAGVALVLEGLHHPSLGYLFQGTLAGDRKGLLIRPYDGADPSEHLGAEICLAGILAARGGCVWSHDGGGDEALGWGVGAGLLPGNAISPFFGAEFDFTRAHWGQVADLGMVNHYNASLWVAL